MSKIYIKINFVYCIYKYKGIIGEFFALRYLKMELFDYREIPDRIDFRVDIEQTRVSFTLYATRLLSPRTFPALIFARNVLPPAPSQAIVRSALSARWIQIVLRQQGYNPADIKLAILDFAKFALLALRLSPVANTNGVLYPPRIFYLSFIQ